MPARCLCRTSVHIHKILAGEPQRRLALQILRSCATKKDSDNELPPEPTTCCMSGCANCVWIEYAELLSKHMQGNNERTREIILSKIEDPNLKIFLSMELRNIQVPKDSTVK